MSVLTDIKAALEAKREALTMLRAELDYRDTPRRIKARDVAQETIHALLTDDTITALVAVAEAADGFVHGDMLGEDLVAALAQLTSDVTSSRCEDPCTEPPETDGIITAIEAREDV